MSFANLWTAPLFSVGGEPVTVGSVALAAVLITGGYFISKAASSIAAKVLARRVQLVPLEIRVVRDEVTE